MIGIKNVKVDLSGIEQKMPGAMKKAQFVLDEAVLKDSNYYIPKDTGELENSGIRYTNPGEGEVIWNTPYARKLFYGTSYNFSKDVNPNASPLWFNKAKSENKDSWVKQAEKAARSEF